MTISSKALEAIAIEAQVLHLHGIAAQHRMDDYLARSRVVAIGGDARWPD